MHSYFNGPILFDAKAACALQYQKLIWKHLELHASWATAAVSREDRLKWLQQHWWASRVVEWVGCRIMGVLKVGGVGTQQELTPDAIPSEANQYIPFVSLDLHQIKS